MKFSIIALLSCIYAFPCVNANKTLSVTGKRTVLAVRIKIKDKKNTFKETELKRAVFGPSTEEDKWNLADGFRQCSYGKLEFVPTDIELNKISDGVVTIDIDNDIEINTVDKALLINIKDNAMYKLNEMYNGTIDDKVDEILFCIPPIGKWTTGSGSTFRAFAGGAGSHWTIYDDDACLSPSYQMHEIGHNLDLSHSKWKDNIYGDSSGLMGYSYSNNEGPRMCFNAAKNYQLGWFEDKTVSLSQDNQNWNGKLIGIVDYENEMYSDKARVLIDINDGTGELYLVSFNRKSSFNDGTKKGEDKVLVHSRNDGKDSDTSDLLRIMDTGDEYITGEIGDKTRFKIKVKKIELNHTFSKISITSYEGNDPTKEPTPDSMEAPGKNKCGKNIPIPTSECPDFLNIRNCFLVAYGELCEGDGECGDTTAKLNNCGKYDIYMKKEDDGKGNCGKLTHVSRKDCPKKMKLKKENCKKALYGEYCIASKNDEINCEEIKNSKCYLKQYQHREL